jgi:hypothetical protein
MKEKNIETKVKRIGEFEVQVFAGVPVVEIDEILDKDIMIHDCEFVEGQFGEYAWILASEDNSSDRFKFSTGGTVVVRRLKHVKEKNAFPVVAKFYWKKGKKNRYMMVE